MKNPTSVNYHGRKGNRHQLISNNLLALVKEYIFIIYMAFIVTGWGALCNGTEGVYISKC